MTCPWCICTLDLRNFHCWLLKLIDKHCNQEMHCKITSFSKEYQEFKKVGIQIMHEIRNRWHLISKIKKENTFFENGECLPEHCRNNIWYWKNLKLALWWHYYISDRREDPCPSLQNSLPKSRIHFNFKRTSP